MESVQNDAQVNQSESVSRARNVLTITNGDSFLGCCIASYILRESELDGRGHDSFNECCVRVLCRRERDCEKLRDMGAEVIEVDYEDREDLRRVFRDSEYAIFVPEMSRKRVRHGERVIEAMESEDVRHVLMLSMIGADTKEKQLKHLCEFRELEKYLEASFSKGRWCIFRLDFLQQFFLPYAPMIEHGILKLNTRRNGRFAPVNIRDVCRATYRTVTGRERDRHDEELFAQGYTIVRAAGAHGATTVSGASTPSGENGLEGFRWGPLDSRHHKKVYRITGPEVVDGEKIASIISEVVGDVRFELVSREEMRRDLERLRHEHRRGRRDDNDNDRYRAIQTGQQGIRTAINGLQSALASIQIASAGVQAAVATLNSERGIQAAIAGTQIQVAVIGIQIAVQAVTADLQDGRIDDRRNEQRRGGRHDDKERRGGRRNDGERRGGRRGDEDRDEERRRRDRNEDERRDRGYHGRRHRDGWFRHAKLLNRHFNKTKIETLLDFFEYVQSDHVDLTSDNLADLFGDEHETLENFFSRHRGEFGGADDDWCHRA